ncbi:hypothetical protein OG264_34500 [Streptomyces xanthophaeus]|nr:hypothetical protein OG264_34500 [Streptomyces xanthophaeus]WST58857.1 hypothetical protein OG605_03935 [Streptomyces xanthophaeus]
MGPGDRGRPRRSRPRHPARARAAALLTLALPGCAYVYQGEELGLAEVEDIPAGLLQDPRWPRSGCTDRGGDGCRVPLLAGGPLPADGTLPGETAVWLRTA